MTQTFWSRAGETWCAVMHRSPMWPFRGYYRCSICLRTHPVSWAHAETSPAEPRGSAPALKREVPEVGSLAVAPVAFASASKAN